MFKLLWLKVAKKWPFARFLPTFKNENGHEKWLNHAVCWHSGQKPTYFFNYLLKNAFI